MSDSLSEFSAGVQPEAVFFSLFFSSHYTAAVAARACKWSGARAEREA